MLELENNINTGVDTQEAISDLQETTQDTEQVEKTLTQAEVDEIVKERLARERKKYADYDDIKEQYETLKEISDVLSIGGISGTPTEQIAHLKQYYGVTQQQAEQMVNASTKNEADETKAFVEAERFSRKATDDEIVDEVERILETPAHKRKEKDLVKLEVLETRYGAIKFRNEFSEAEKWYKENADGDFKDLVNDDDFKDFIEGSNAPLKKMVQKYLKYAGKTKEPKSPGSAKDTGGTTAKEYYTPAEVDKLTEAQLANPKIWAKVRESMTKWK
jgi:hypothetical protein